MTARSSQPDAPPPGSEPRGYTIDELAAATGVPSRTIRFYQAKGALPPPERQGRVAIYRDHHIERLKVVAELQDRGLHLRAIRELLDRARDQGDVSLREWAGFGEALQAPWSDDSPRVFPEQELIDLAGPNARPGLLADLVRIGLIERQGNARPPTYLVASPALLHTALELQAAGIDLDTASGAERILRKRMARAADELVEFFKHRAGQGFGRKGEPHELGKAIEALRPAAADAARRVFTQEIERALRQLVEQGGSSPRHGRRR